MKKSKTVLPVPAQAIESLETRSRIVAKIQCFSIKTQADYTAAEAAVKRIVDYRKAVHDVFDEQLSSAKATVKAINKQVDRFERVPAQVEEDLRDEMSSWLTESQRKAEAAREKKIEKAAARGDEERVKELEQAPVRAPTGEGVSTRKNWYAEVIDAKLVPAEFFIGAVACGCSAHVDMKKLDSVARAMKDLFNVPGAAAKWTASAIVA